RSKRDWSSDVCSSDLLVQGWIWTIAYFLYLPYTVTFVVYDVLAPEFPGIHPYRWVLELVLPVAIVPLVLAPVRMALAALLLVGEIGRASWRERVSLAG